MLTQALTGIRAFSRDAHPHETHGEAGANTKTGVQDTGTENGLDVSLGRLLRHVRLVDRLLDLGQVSKKTSNDGFDAVLKSSIILASVFSVACILHVSLFHSLSKARTTWKLR